MNTPDPNDPITRWTDGAMSPEECASFKLEMQNNAPLRAEVEALENLGQLLRSHVRMEAKVPNADFFNSQIQERITEMQSSESRAKGTSVMQGLLSWLMRPWAIAGAVAALTLGFFAWRSFDADDGTQVLGFYAPDSAVHASSYHDNEANAAVVTLDGLADIPDDQPVSGASPDHAVNHPKTSSSTLPNSQGAVLIAMVGDGGGTPMVLMH